ncbi:unnamed protein product [Clonostachys rosea]|uniref:Anaphase-promoting complex subunit 11 n=1 Tax=Bionectria ochroleuca TaxID=29856 RepID=A0ABY6UY54_BIOOC|nr:unnamed protein product [Clonostachys rosea]
MGSVKQPGNRHLRQPGVNGETSIGLGTSVYAPIDLTQDSSEDEHAAGSSKKRRRSDEECQGRGASSLKRAIATPTRAHPPSSSPTSTKEYKDGATQEPSPEKRLRRFRPQPPQSFSEILYRATSQRFFVLERTRAGTEDCPEEIVELTGSTGNIYTVSIGLVPRCDCPHAKKGNQCKHIIFVMKKVLNAPYHLVYQLALVKSELIEIFKSAPPISTSSSEPQDKNRKSLDNDCPICFSEFDKSRPKSIVWCRAACGQNMHQECFQTWARTKVGRPTCPMCRSVWEEDASTAKQVSRSQGRLSEGYVNVANQLGINGRRDTSTYSEWYFRPSYGRRSYGRR